MPGTSQYRPLPPAARLVLEQVSAPPRLIAHLTLTHDVAAQLLASLRTSWPGLAVNESAVLFGAAIHDAGKALHPEELQQPGSEHEAAGEQLLLGAGVAPELAGFCRTHGAWRADGAIEDLLVTLADNVWKGKRDEPLEQALLDHIARTTGDPRWQVFVTLDELLTCIADTAEERLAWQNGVPV